MSSIYISITQLKIFQDPVMLLATTVIAAASGFEFINYNLYALAQEDDIKLMVRYFGYGYHYIFLIALLIIYGIYKNKKHVTN